MVSSQKPISSGISEIYICLVLFCFVCNSNELFGWGFCRHFVEANLIKK